MPADLFSRVDLDLLHLPFLERVLALVAECRYQGVTFYAISGTRTYTEQQALYDQGRTKPGKVVTKAKPGQSYHQHGLALDLCRDADVDRAGLQPDWRLAEYEILAKLAPKHGLVSGLSFKTFREGPHVQATLPPGVTLAGLDAIHRAKGLKAVWAHLDIRP